MGHETKHYSPFSVEVRNALSYYSTPPYIFMAWCLIKHCYNFTYFAPNPIDCIYLKIKFFA
jgi:hypothetical protein